MSKKIIGILVGSARKESYSKKIADFISTLLPSDFETRLIKIDNLALYNQDYDDEGTTPAEWTVFRNNVKDLDGFLFVTPEHNRSYTALLKNALDIGSRPYGQSVWNGKPAGVVSVSPGTIAGFGANHHLRQPLMFLNMPVMQQPEAYIGDVINILDDKGVVTNQDSINFLKGYTDSFVKWVNIFG